MEKPKYDIFIRNELFVTFYTNEDTRQFVEVCINDDTDIKDIIVKKDGQPLTIDIYQKVSIGAM